MTTHPVPMVVLCDCEHPAADHEQPALTHHGAVPWQACQEWCSQCPCTRFNPAEGHSDHDPDA